MPKIKDVHEFTNSVLTIGMQSDPLFGPLSFGLGRYSEVLRTLGLPHQVYRITPLTERDAAEMVRSVHGFPLLTGYRGHPASDLEAVQETLLRVSRLVEELPELASVDLDPVRAFPPGQGFMEQGAVVLGARIAVAPEQGLGGDSG